jgi:hypothetical protein
VVEFVLYRCWRLEQRGEGPNLVIEIWAFFDDEIPNVIRARRSGLDSEMKANLLVA